MAPVNKKLQDTAVTLNHYVPTMVDAMTKRNYTLALQASIRNTVAGGDLQTFVAQMAPTGNVDWYKGCEDLDCKSGDSTTRGCVEWNQFKASEKFCGIELAKNSGPGKWFDLIRTRINAVEEGIACFLEDTFVGGNGDGKTCNDPIGLASITDPCFGGGETYTELSGIKPDNEDCIGWLPLKLDAQNKPFSTAMLTQAGVKFENRGAKRPTIALTTPEIYIDALLQVESRQTFEGNTSGMAMTGFDGVIANGFELAFSRGVPDGVIYLLNPEGLRQDVLAGTWLEAWTEIPECQDAVNYLWKTYFATYVMDRRSQGQICNVASKAAGGLTELVKEG